MADALTREEFREHFAAFERRIVERLDLLERLIALGFDTGTDRLRVPLGDSGADRINPSGTAQTANAVLGNGRN